MKRLDVVFLHPDLGIGGAERLVVDAAVAAQECGHRVRFVTNHHNPEHCFDETRDGGSVAVTVVGDWLPRTVLGRCYALCSYARMIYAALYVAFVCSPRPDVVFVDQVSACVPVLRWRGLRVVYYCHYPDLLLARGRDSRAVRLYRAPLDRLEEATAGLADVLLVNSRFTQSVFRDTFRRVRRLPDVLYPSINTAQFERVDAATAAVDVVGDGRYVLSLNRFERKKDIALAVRCVRLLPTRHGDVRLVVAGGYDRCCAENVEHYDELRRVACDERVEHRVVFLQSPSDVAKTALLRGCACLVYTPTNEHFGIVPLEAMYCGRPVVAANSGGPMETVVDGQTGYLRDPEPERFADAVARLLDADGPAELFGARGRKRFDDMFSFAAFRERINGALEKAWGSA